MKCLNIAIMSVAVVQCVLYAMDDEARRQFEHKRRMCDIEKEKIKTLQTSDACMVSAEQWPSRKACIERVITDGAHPDECCLEYGTDGDVITPLWHAVYHDDRTCVDMLLTKKADANQAWFDGRTPFFKARSVSVAQVLLHHKARHDVRTTQGLTLLHTSATQPLHETALIPWYVSQGLDVDTPDQSGRSPLMCVERPHSVHGVHDEDACRRTSELVRMFIRCGASVDGCYARRSNTMDFIPPLSRSLCPVVMDSAYRAMEERFEVIHAQLYTPLPADLVTLVIRYYQESLASQYTYDSVKKYCVEHDTHAVMHDYDVDAKEYTASIQATRIPPVLAPLARVRPEQRCAWCLLCCGWCIDHCSVDD